MFNIIESKKWLFGISGAIILVGIISMAFRGFNLDVDFKGGTAIGINMGQDFETSEITEIITQTIGIKPSTVQKAGDSGHEVVIKMEELSSEQREAVYNAIAERYGLEAGQEEFEGDHVHGNELDIEGDDPELVQEIEDAQVHDDELNSPEDYNEETGRKYSGAALLYSDNFSATVGKELQRSAIWASVIAVILMLAYISFRFKFTFGVAAIIALVHDVLVMLTAYTLLWIPINMSFVAAILTILGYSINATIVIFDRVRENIKSSKKPDYAEIANRSVWQTMSRSINTSITTLLTITALYVVGVESIKDFALPLMVGIIAGAYSSMFISAPVWVMLNSKKVKAKK